MHERNVGSACLKDDHLRDLGLAGVGSPKHHVDRLKQRLACPAHDRRTILELQRERALDHIDHDGCGMGVPGRGHGSLPGAVQIGQSMDVVRPWQGGNG